MAFELRSRALFCLLLLGVCFMVKTCPASSADSSSKTSFTLFRFLYMPLLDVTSRTMSVHEVPVILHGNAPASIVEVMGAAVFPASQNSADRTSDLNLISLAKIRMTLIALKDERGYDLMIDLTGAQKPDGAKAEVADVVQGIITCLRLTFPQSWYGRMNIKLIGVSENDAVLEKMQGPLWHSD
jgi:hypothetical protein